MSRKSKLPSPKSPLKIGTRASPLALAQANEVLSKLSSELELPFDAFEIVKIKTTGDLLAERPLNQLGGKGLFTKEIEECLSSGKIDIAVHSMKDMPVDQPSNLVIDTYLPREDARDAFLSYSYKTIKDLDNGAILGTSSVRRRAQILNIRRDLQIIGFRGNIQTRIQKLKNSNVSATFLALAGLNRLGLSKVPATAIEIEEMLPAIAQGVIGVQRRKEDHCTALLLEFINDCKTKVRVQCERAYLRQLSGSCQTPIAGLATLDKGDIILRAEIIHPDGQEKVMDFGRSLIEDGNELGIDIAEKLKKQVKFDIFF